MTLTHHRSIFISDVHIGSYDNQLSLLNNFLKHNTSDNLYLVGDIIDGWKLKFRFYWSHEASKIVKKIFKKSKAGTKVVYITGNHDEFLREWIEDGINIEGIELTNSYTHMGANGKKYLVIHGDLFDGISRMNKYISYFGDCAYTFSIKMNKFINLMRKFLGFAPWSFSAFCKSNVKKAVIFIGDFENNIVEYCRLNGYDGIICGHIHTPCIKNINGIEYINCGDWVESGTAIVEDELGNFRLIKWKEEME